MKEMLNIINEDDEIIGEESRENIHKYGLLHREIHIYFITPNKEIIFQHRAKDKDTYPDLLDATVGGHVEIGDSYEETAIKEAREETGIIIDPKDLIFISKTKKRSKDVLTGKTNYAIRQSYVYIFKGDIKDLRLEEGKSLGFQVMTKDGLLNIKEDKAKKFIPYILNFSQQELVNFINNR